MALSSEKSVAVWVDWVFRNHPLTNIEIKSTTSQHLMRHVQAGRFSTFMGPTEAEKPIHAKLLLTVDEQIAHLKAEGRRTSSSGWRSTF